MVIDYFIQVHICSFINSNPYCGLVIKLRLPLCAGYMSLLSVMKEHLMWLALWEISDNHAIYFLFMHIVSFL